MAKKHRRSLTHDGRNIGSSNVTLSQNTTGQFSQILKWTCPQKFVEIMLAGGQHSTVFVPRYMESFSGTAGDDTTQMVSGNLQPPAGETTQSEHPYPPVIAYNKTQSKQYDISSYDYSANQITLATDPSDGDTVKLYPILTSGQIKLQAIDQFGNLVGPVDEWGVPISSFHDVFQLKGKTSVHIPGAVSWTENEAVALYLDSPRNITWTDSDYPNGSYVSTIEQEVDVKV